MPGKTDASVARRVQANRRLVRDGASTEDVDRAKARLDAVFSAYPGLVAGSCFDADGEGFSITCVFGPGDLGRAAALAVDFIAARVGAVSEPGPDATRVRCSATSSSASSTTCPTARNCRCHIDPARA